jgi:AcrR family transcriptional regulator
VTGDLRSRKKRETCRALKSAALRLVDAHGLEHVTVEMIAAAADVSPRTFFNHFPSKEDALLGPGAEVRAEIEQFWSQRPADEAPLTSLRALLLDRAAALSTHSDEMDLRMRVLAANPALYVRFHASFLELERVIRAAVAARCGMDAHRDLYPALVASAGSAAMRVSMDLWRGGDQRPLAGIVEDVFDLYAAGLAAPPVTRTAVRQRRRTDTPCKV